MIFRLLLLKRRIESLLMLPLVAVGYFYGLAGSRWSHLETVFFFPFYHTGGAEKIHAQIAQSCGSKNALIVFTRHSRDGRFKEDFSASGCTILDISRLTGSKWLYPVNFILRGVWAARLNRCRRLHTIFNGHSNFAYKLSPWLRKSIRQVDLVHSWNSFSLIRIPYIPFYAASVQISQVQLKKHQEKYAGYGVEQRYIDRFHFIQNSVPFPVRAASGKPRQPFIAVFSGRPGPEKRFPLFARVARLAQQENLPVQFRAIGISESDAGTASGIVECLGNISDAHIIHDLLYESRVLLLTSSTEGFPLVVIEAMANGCAVFATPVGDIPLHTGNGQPGVLFSTSTNETAIVAEAMSGLRKMVGDPDSWDRIAQANIDYAQERFSMSVFDAAYRKLILTHENPPA